MLKNWKNKIIAFSVTTLFLFSGQAFAQSQAEEWKKVANEVNEEQDKALENVAGMEKYIKMDMDSLKKELADLKQEDDQAERDLQKLVKDFEKLLAVEKQHIKDLENEQQEIDDIEGTVRAVVKDAISKARDNPITVEHPERIEILDQIKSSKRFPGMDWIKTLVDFYFQEMEESAKIIKRTGEFVGPDGKLTTGEIVRIGRFTTYYRLTDGSVGFLTPEADGRRLVAVTGDAPSHMLKSINEYFEGQTEVAPVDLSNGAFFVQLSKTDTLVDQFNAGGIFMWPILIVGALGILLGIERFIVLSTKSKASDKVMDHIKSMANQGNWQEAKNFCSSKSRIPTCQMLEGAIENVGHTQEVLENSLQEAILRQVPKLERFLPTIALFAVISPLLGLLGTVTGMITTFKVLMEVGTSNAGMLAGGISEALLTTKFGLVVAVPLMIIHHFLKSQVDGIINDMEEKGTSFAITLIKQGDKEA